MPKTVPQDMDLPALTDWLRLAIDRRAPISGLTPDELPHVTLARMAATWPGEGRRTFEAAMLLLTREFCANDGMSDSAAMELIGLIGRTRNNDCTEALAQLAEGARFPTLSGKVAQALLAVLADSSPTRPARFWFEVAARGPQFFSVAFTGLLNTVPFEAVSLLREAPNTTAISRAVALKVELAWDSMAPSDRFRFVDAVRGEAVKLPGELGTSLRSWVDSKTEQTPHAPSPLASALLKAMGADAAPRVRTPRLTFAVAA